MKETCTNPNPDCDCPDHHVKHEQEPGETFNAVYIGRNDGVIPDNCPDCFPYPCIHS